MANCERTEDRVKQQYEEADNSGLSKMERSFLSKGRVFVEQAHWRKLFRLSVTAI